jgi:hypothetical protein
METMELLVYTPAATPRVRYAFSLLFDSALKARYAFTTDPAAYLAAAGPRLNYSMAPLAAQEIWLPAGPLLHEQGVEPLAISFFQHQGLPAFFRQGDAQGAALPFDLPALAFFLASRYEEYLPFAPDALGRFPAEASSAYRGGFLEQPLINQWARRLAALLSARFPELEIQFPAYRFQPSYDIDMAWAYRHRPLWLTAAASLRDLLQGQWGTSWERLLVLARQREDPFFTFDYLQQLHQQHDLSPLFFFLLGDWGAYDKNIKPTVPAFQRLLRQLAAQARQVGLHPSYRAQHQAGQLEKEAQRFTAILGQPLQHSRQHFLLLRFPHTYQRLLSIGIQHDYTMGFADAVGFRASLATPFPWYDLTAERTAPLLLHPFAAMDTTLRKYMTLPPAAAAAKLCALADSVREVGGDFITLWHNSSFSVHHGWLGWRAVYEKVVSYAR